MTFWEKIYEETINLSGEVEYDLSEIIVFTRVKLEKILEPVKNINSSCVNVYKFFLEEILKNSIDANINRNFFDYLKTKQIKIKIYRKENEIVFLIRDNWKWSKEVSSNEKVKSNKYLWWMWQWENNIRFFENSIVKKYRRISIKWWTVVILKINTWKKLSKDEEKILKYLKIL